MAHIKHKRKALFIKGFFDAERLIRIAKSEAVKTGLRGKINVIELGHYNPKIDGQAVIVEESGSEYKAAGSGSPRSRKNIG
ncbi:MAG TPA: hypothetical protein ENN36_04485 [Candidatus Bathyarchaeota archaeon]|jgi:hypothetical protein|nr:hypothetical protein [Candidatus Bathyarchaeota archaeon]